MILLNFLINVLLLLLSNEGPLLVDWAGVEELIRVVEWVLRRVNIFVLSVIIRVVLTLVEALEMLAEVGASGEGWIVPVIKVVVKSHQVLL